MNSTVKCKIDSADDFASSKDCTTQRTIVVVNCILNVPLMLTSITGNALVVAAIINTTSIRSTSMTMLLSLAVSDLLVGSISQPLFIAGELTNDSFLERLAEMTEFALCGVSVCTMTAISVDRFLALQYPMRYQSFIITKPRVMYTSIIIIWIINVFSSGLYLWSWLTYFGIMAVGLCSCIFLSTFCYVKIYRIVRQHQVQIQAQQLAAAQSLSIGKNSNILQNTKRSALNTFIFYIAMILCYFPILISMSLSSISYKDWTKAWHLADTVLFSNSSINPLLYCWRLRDLRTAVVKTSRKLLCKQTDAK